MLLGEIIAVALQAIRANKLRSLLTMLGIIIGVGAVITMIALGSGAQKSVQDRIQALGPTLLSLYPGQSFMRGVASDVRVSLTMDDDTALANNARYVTDVVPELSRNLQVQKGTQNINVNIVGTTPNYVPVKNYTITAGRMFTAGDDAARRRFAVLGSAVPNMLNANAAAMIGQELLIRGIPFEIIGILSEKGSQGSFFNPDEQILIPLQTARYRILGTDRLRSITVKVQDMSVMNLAMIDLERVLRRQHKIRPGQRLPDPQPDGHSRHPAADDRDLQVPAGGDRRREPARGRHRDHEHHAGVGHRAHARDRRAQGARRHAVQRHVPVPGRGAGAVPGRRDDRSRVRHDRRGRAVQAGALEHADLPVRHPARVPVQRGGRPVLRDLAGEARGEPRSHRGAPIRIRRGEQYLPPMSGPTALEQQLTQETLAKQRQYVLSNTRARWSVVGIAVALLVTARVAALVPISWSFIAGFAAAFAAANYGMQQL